MAEWARLLSECRGNLVAGSNPALPATENVFRKERVFVFWSRASTGEMIFESRPPRHKKNALCKERVFCFALQYYKNLTAVMMNIKPSVMGKKITLG